MILLGGIIIIAIIIKSNISSRVSPFVTPVSVKTYSPQIPTINSIFTIDHSWTATLSAEHKRVILATGDIIPARSVNNKLVLMNSYTWPYEKTADVVKNADITFANLETPLIKDCRPTVEGMVFCGSNRNIEGLVFAGVDIVNLANNHAGNYEERGVHETAIELKKAGILVTGIKGPLYQDIRGIQFAFLGYNDITTPQPGIANADEELIKQEIAQARKNADVVIVTYHWGVEYRNQPDDRQLYLGHFTIDSGADLVIGNHPHWIQPIEFYKGKLITYAHGNFVFDQMWSEETKHGVLGRYTFYDNTLVDVEYLPIYIEDYGQPHFLEGQQKTKVLKDMEKESEILATNSGGIL